MMSAVAASAAVIPVTVLVCERRPWAFLAAQLAGLALATTMAVFWWTRWPSRRQSQAAVLTGLTCIAVWSQAQRNIEESVPICMAAAITGGYIAFYHGARLMIVNLVVALGLNVATVVRLAGATEIMTAARAFWLIWFFNLAVPLAAWGAVRAIRAYVSRSNEDPLTGLLNRRAFTPAVLADLTLGAVDADDHLTLVMVDLDNFKGINDNYGHVTGDKTLVAVADLLRRSSAAGVPICRAGGEEFLVALIGEPRRSAAWAEDLCRQTATLTPPITASIGTVGIALSRAPQPATVDFVERLIQQADQAMYTAKRRGGNHARHASADTISERQPRGGADQDGR